MELLIKNVYCLNAYVYRIHLLYCSASLKAQEKLFNFKTEVQESTFQMKQQQKEIVMLPNVANIILSSS